MKDIKRALSEYTVPVEEAEWQKISSDTRLVKYNRACKIRRWATWGGGATVGIIGIVVGSLLLTRPEKTVPAAEPTQPVTVEETAQASPALREALAPDASATADNPVNPAETKPVTNTYVYGESTPSSNEPMVAPSTSSLSVDNPIANNKVTANNQLASTTTTVATPAAPTVSEKKTIRIEDEPLRISKPETETESEMITPKSQSEPAAEAESAYQIFVPNSFTPDGNGTNDLFMPKASFTVKDYEINIFSRNGGRVFTSRNIEQGWDGYNHGTLLPSGAYLYVIRYTDPDGNTKTLKGQVVLLK
ncbi:MAG: gliding motility-associated C-terminal domain-containing protein [Bacteroidales bacterium]|nr:gliding motility-associated C-terminal domain-containing protein [Bacteroidales bacterium]